MDPWSKEMRLRIEGAAREMRLAAVALDTALKMDDIDASRPKRWACLKASLDSLSRSKQFLPLEDSPLWGEA